MKKINPKYIQLFGDAIIPLLGFFVWDWNLYFILLFYFLDMLTKEVLLHVKAKKISHHLGQLNSTKSIEEMSNWLKLGMMSCLIFIFIVLLIQLSMPSILSAFNAEKEIYEFWFYEEMGIEQGYILLPLIVLMGYTQYKMEFLVPQLFARITMRQLWKPHLQSMLTILAFSGFSFGLVHFVTCPQWIFVVGIVVVSSGFQLFFLKK